MRNAISRVNLLAIVAGALIAASFKYPWWSLAFTGMSGTGRADIYPYIIAGDLPELLGYRRTSQMAIMVPVLIACVVLCLLAGLLRGKAGRITLAVVGVVVAAILYAFLRRIRIIARGYGVPLEGHAFGQIDIAAVEMITSFGRGIYLLGAGGIAALLASLLHPWVRIPAARPRAGGDQAERPSAS